MKTAERRFLLKDQPGQASPLGSAQVTLNDSQIRWQVQRDYFLLLSGSLAGRGRWPVKRFLLASERRLSWTSSKLSVTRSEVTYAFSSSRVHSQSYYDQAIIEVVILFDGCRCFDGILYRSEVAHSLFYIHHSVFLKIRLNRQSHQ